MVYCTLPLNLAALLIFNTGPKKLCFSDVVDIWPDVLPFPSIVKVLLFPLFYCWRQSFKYVISLSDVILSVSDSFLEQSIENFTLECTAAKRIYIGCKSMSVAPKRQIDNDCLTVVYIGNIGYLYDFETLLEAIFTCPINTRFFLVGDGDRKEWLLEELNRLDIDYQYLGGCI